MVKNAKKLEDEINVMKILDHPNIVRLYETFEDSRSIYLIVELCTGGELFDAVLDAGQYNEKVHGPLSHGHFGISAGYPHIRVRKCISSSADAFR